MTQVTNSDFQVLRQGANDIFSILHSVELSQNASLESTSHDGVEALFDDAYHMVRELSLSPDSTVVCSSVLHRSLLTSQYYVY